MQGLMNGADCSVQGNPLNQVLKREGVDNSLFRVSLLCGRETGNGCRDGSFSPQPTSRRRSRRRSRSHCWYD